MRPAPQSAAADLRLAQSPNASKSPILGAFVAWCKNKIDLYAGISLDVSNFATNLNQFFVEMKTILKILLACAIVVLGYCVYESVMQPIRFGNEKDKRYAATIQRLKDIRTAQVAYRCVYDKSTGSFDTLINFLKEGQFTVVRQIGSEDDSLAVARKQVFREEVKVNVRDSLFKGMVVDSLRYVPFAGNSMFEMQAGEIETNSKIKVKVFECKAHNDVILKGLDRQEIVNLNDLARTVERFPGLQVGSLEAATNNAGNWE